MIQAKFFNLAMGSSVKPHSHANRVVINCLLQGALQESRLDPSQTGSLSIQYHFAPKILVRSGHAIHTLKASVDSMLWGASFSWPNQHQVSPVLIALINTLVVFSPTVEACVDEEIKPQMMLEHRMGRPEAPCFLKALEHKAQSGDVEAQITLGISLMEGYAGVEEPSMGMYWLTRAAEKEEGQGFYEAYVADAEEGYVC